MEEENQFLTLKPTTAFELLNIGRTTGYQLLRTGEIRSIRIGRSIRIPLSALEEWLKKKLAESSDDQAGQE